MTLALTLAAIMIAAPFASAGGWSVHVRDRMLLGLGWASTLALLFLEPGLAILFGMAVWRWTSWEHIAPVAMWTAISGVYVVIVYGPAVEGVLPPAIVVGACVQAVLALMQYTRARWAGVTWHEARAGHAHGRTSSPVVLATLLAIAVPLAPLWAMPVLVAGLLITYSYVGVVAAIVGFLVAHPSWALPATAPLLVLVALVIWYRGGARDSLRERRKTWSYAAATLVRKGWPAILFGLGHESWKQHATWWSRGARLTHERFVFAHNDGVQLLFEYGLLGCAGAALWGFSVARGGFMGDPLTGALLAGLVASLGQFPCALPQTGIPLLAVAGLIARRMVG